MMIQFDSATATMRFKELSKFLLVFFIFGQSPHSLLRAPNSIQLRVILISSVTLMFLMAVLSCVVLMYQSLGTIEHKFEESFTAIMGCLFITIECITAGIIFAQSVLFQHDLYELWSKLQQLDLWLEAKFQKHVCFAAFNNTFRKRAALIFILFTAKIWSTYLANSNSTIDNFRVSLLAFLLFFSIVGNFHALFYIEILVLFKDHVCETISSAHQVDCERSIVRKNIPEKIFKTLQDVKYVFHEMKDICEIINRHFGWSIIAICLKNCIDFVYAIFLIAVRLQMTDPGCFYMITRENEIVYFTSKSQPAIFSFQD